MKEANEEEYCGKEKRDHPRIEANFMVKYGPRRQREQESDITHIKNISQSGLLFTTSKEFGRGELLFLDIRVPFFSRNVEVVGEVIGSHKKTGSIYDTRVKFLNLEKEVFSQLNEFISMRRG